MKKTVWCLMLLCVLSSAAFAQSKREQENARLLQVDADFAKLSVEKGPGPAFAAYLADDAVFMPMGEHPMSGKESIVKYFEGDYTLTWKPLKAEVAQSGELGYSYGVSEFRSKDKDGKEQVRYFKYVSVWKRQKNGAWKLAVDMGNPNPAPTQ